jgi:hypothetical protein
MGRFYKTAKPTFVDDIIYQAPHELMLNALTSHQEKFDQQKEVIDSFSAAGENLDYVDKDSEARQAAIDKHRNKSNELADKIAKNPALYQHYMGEINKAKRDYEYDMTQGDLFQMDRTAKRREKVRAAEKVRLDKGEISADQYQAAIDTLDRQYEGVGKGNYDESIHIYNKVDENALVKNLKDNINVSTTGVSTTQPDKPGYMIKEGSTTAYLTKERLEQIIEADPQMQDWRNAELQTMERQLANGALTDKNGRPITDEDGMRAEYLKRSEDFKKSTIDKLAYQKTDVETAYSNDASYWAGKSNERAWYQIRKKEEKEGGDVYELNVTGQYKELDAGSVENIFSIGGLDKTYGNQIPNAPVNADGSIPKTPYTKAQMVAYLNNEKANLATKLKAIDMPQETFKEKMKDYNERTKLAKQLGVTVELLARQANYDTSYEYRAVRSPDRNGEDYNLNQQYEATIVKGVNNMGAETIVKAKIIRPDGTVVSDEDITLGNANKQGYITPQQVATVEEDLVPLSKDGNVGYKGHTGEVVMMPSGETEEVNGKIRDKEIPATKEYVVNNGLGVTKKVQGVKSDDTKPLVNIDKDRITTSEITDYGNGRSAPKTTKYYNVHTYKNVMNPSTGKMEQHTVILQIPEKDFDIKMLRTQN